jgi:hypothetical protein
MNPMLKKILAALAIKEGIEKIQEMRRPKRSFVSRMIHPLVLLGLGGGAFYLYKNGHLAPVVEQAKGLMGSKDDDAGSYGSGPGATNGSATVGAGSVSS